MRHTFTTEQWLPYPVDLVFAFFANPENLPHLMPRWQQAHIEQASLTPPTPRPAETSALRTIAADLGSRITISFRPFPYSPIRIPWEAEITDFVWSDHFTDLQLRGPFAYWLHRHSVQPATRPDHAGRATHGTLLRDEVIYEPPLGKLGELARYLFINRQLRNTFAYRQTRTSKLLPFIL